jgi:hypothetical protein
MGGQRSFLAYRRAGTPARVTAFPGKDRSSLRYLRKRSRIIGQSLARVITRMTSSLIDA